MLDRLIAPLVIGGLIALIGFSMVVVIRDKGATREAKGRACALLCEARGAECMRWHRVHQGFAGRRWIGTCTDGTQGDI
jgi:hypothetical protein